MRFIILCAVTAVLVGGWVRDAGAQAQLGAGAIVGDVEDTSRGAVPGASVTVTNTETGATRSDRTSNIGQFTFPVLPPGRYAVRIELDGFRTIEQGNIIVNVGRTATLRFTLEVGGMTDVVTVTAATPLVDTTKTEETTLINREQIHNLPINGRRADQFALLAPGVTRDGRFGLLSYRGQSGVFNNFTLEGNDDNQAYFAEARGRTAIASNISANAIQEFQVGQSNFLPEFGRSAGGSINAVVRSGTNQFHSDAFYYFRNQKLNARDPLATINPEEKRQQFGGSIGGPIVRNRLLYFFNYDQQARTFPIIIEDLSGALTRGLPVNPTAADQQAFAAGTTYIRGLFPGGAPGNTLPREANQKLVLGKVDAVLNPSHTLAVTYNYLNFRSPNGQQTPLVLGNVGRNGTLDIHPQSLHSRLTSIVSNRSVNELRFQFSREHQFAFANADPPQVFVGGTGDAAFSFGRANFYERPALPDERRLQFVDNLTLSLGAHNVKFGADVNYVRDKIDNPSNFGGTYSYSSALQLGRDLLNPTGRNYTNFSQSFGLPGITFSTIDFATFVQDQWKAGKRLTVNYGVRYDYQHNPEPFAPNPAVPDTARINADRSNIGPRVGVAYDVSGDGRTVVRTGYGVYYGRTPNGTIQNALRQTGLLDPTLSTIALTLTPVDAGAPVYPNILPALPANAAGSTTLFILEPDFKRPRMQEANLGVERQIGSDTSVSASFVYTKGDRLPISYDSNLPAPQFTRRYQLPSGSIVELPFSAGVTRTAAGVAQNVNAARPNPNFGAISQLRSGGETWYRGLLFEVKRRLANNLQFNVSYTLASAENLSGAASGGGGAAETPFGGGSFFNQFDIESNRGPAPTDQRQRLVVNGLWALPYGFRLSGIYSAESGRPFAALVTVPNLPFTLDGVQYNGFGGLLGQGTGADRSLAPGVERNSDYGDANYRLDLRLARDFKLRNVTFEVVAEGFNIFNRANFNGFQGNLYDAQATAVGTPLSTPIVLTGRPDFGVANNDSSQPDGTNARRFQVALRFRM